MTLSRFFASARTPSLEKIFVQEFAQHPLFAGMDAAALKALFRAGHVRKLREGERIFAPNSEGQALYLILQGKVEVELAEERLHLGVGESLGESGAVGRILRGAGASMLNDGSLLALFHEDLVHLGKREPALARDFWLNLSGVLADRLVRP